MTTAAFYRTMDHVTLEHARICGATVTQYELNPTDFNVLRLDEGETYRGVPVTSSIKIPRGAIRVVCTDGHGSPFKDDMDEENRLTWNGAIE